MCKWSLLNGNIEDAVIIFDEWIINQYSMSAFHLPFTVKIHPQTNKCCIQTIINDALSATVASSENKRTLYLNDS